MQKKDRDSHLTSPLNELVGGQNNESYDNPSSEATDDLSFVDCCHMPEPSSYEEFNHMIAKRRYLTFNRKRGRFIPLNKNFEIRVNIDYTENEILPCHFLNIYLFNFNIFYCYIP